MGFLRFNHVKFSENAPESMFKYVINTSTRKTNRRATNLFLKNQRNYRTNDKRISPLAEAPAHHTCMFCRSVGKGGARSTLEPTGSAPAEPKKPGGHHSYNNGALIAA